MSVIRRSLSGLQRMGILGLKEVVDFSQGGFDASKRNHRFAQGNEDISRRSMPNIGVGGRRSTPLAEKMIGPALVA